MRVLQVIPSVSERSGGPATAIVPLCRALKDQRVEVLLVTTNDGLPDAGVNGVTDYKGVPARFFPAQLGHSFKYSRPIAAWLKANVRQFDLAHIHAVFNHTAVAAARECRKSNVPYVVRPLGTLDPWSMKQKPLRKRFFWLFSGKTMLNRSAAVHYTAHAEKDATESYLKLNHGTVIPLGVDVSTGDVQVNPSDPYVLVLSRLHPKKAIDVLIDSFKQLVQDPRFDRWRLVIAGDGPLDHVVFLKGRARTSEKIVFTGWVEGKQKDALLAGASLLALPSRQENFGLCVMEAMARGVPVLLSPHVNLAREVENAEAGWIAAVHRDALAAALGQALQDDAERKRRGQAARALSERYSWQKTAAELADLYREILKRAT